MDGDLDDMEAMMINDNNDDMIADDDVLSQRPKASGKPQSWVMDVVPSEGGNENVGLGVDSPSNLNDSDASSRPCRNSIQASVKHRHWKWVALVPA